MSYPPILDIQSFNRAKDNHILGIPSADEAIKAAIRVIDATNNNTMRGHHLSNGSDVIELLLQAALVPQAIPPPLTPSVNPPPPPLGV
jgi:hypothetical protein